MSDVYELVRSLYDLGDRCIPVEVTYEGETLTVEVRAWRIVAAIVAKHDMCLECWGTGTLPGPDIHRDPADLRDCFCVGWSTPSADAGAAAPTVSPEDIPW